MTPRTMKPTRAVKVWRRGPKTEAQRVQALAALRRLRDGLEADFGPATADTCADITGAIEGLTAAPLRGAV